MRCDRRAVQFGGHPVANVRARNIRQAIVLLLLMIASIFGAWYFGKPADSCSNDPSVHVQHVYLEGEWKCIPPDEAG